MVFIQILYFFAGLLLLYIGAELLVRNASRIALLMRITPLVVGLTVVAFGTSAPEFLVSFIAAFEGNISMAVGNVVGSNIANIGLVLALSAILLPITKLKEKVSHELYWMIIVSILFYLLGLNNKIESWEGIALTSAILLFTTILIRRSIKQRDAAVSEEVPSIETGWKWLDNLKNWQRIIFFLLFTFVGIAILAAGSKITINAAIEIARIFEINERIIGLSMVAFGTSLPELATGIISVAKKENEILVGNVIGSNLFNILAVAGPVSTFFPLPMQDSTLFLDMPVMLGLSAFLFFLLLIPKKVGRMAGVLMFATYIIYISTLFYQP